MAVISQCYGSIGARCDMQVHEYVDGEWKLLYDIPAGTAKADLPWRSAK